MPRKTNEILKTSSQSSNRGTASTTKRSKAIHSTSRTCENTEPISKFFTKVESNLNQSVYSDVIRDVKVQSVSKRKGSIDEDFIAPKSIKVEKIAKVFIDAKGNATKSKRITRSSAKKVSSEEIKLNAIAQGSDIDIEELQLALALSKSLEPNFDQVNDLNREQEPYPSTQQITETAKIELRRFRVKSSDIDALPRTAKNNKSKKKSRFRFITPIIILRTEEDRQRMVNERLEKILNCNCEEISPSSAIAQSEELKPFSVLLQRFFDKKRKLFTISRQDQSDKENYYVPNFITDRDIVVSGSLLKNWDLIAGRDKSPVRQVQILRKSAIPDAGTCEITAFHDEKELDQSCNADSKRCDSPDLFESYLCEEHDNVFEHTNNEVSGKTIENSGQNQAKSNEALQKQIVISTLTNNTNENYENNSKPIILSQDKLVCKESSNQHHPDVNNEAMKIRESEKLLEDEDPVTNRVDVDCEELMEGNESNLSEISLCAFQKRNSSMNVTNYVHEILNSNTFVNEFKSVCINDFLNSSKIDCEISVNKDQLGGIHHTGSCEDEEEHNYIDLTQNSPQCDDQITSTLDQYAKDSNDLEMRSANLEKSSQRSFVKHTSSNSLNPTTSSQDSIEISDEELNYSCLNASCGTPVLARTICTKPNKFVISDSEDEDSDNKEIDENVTNPNESINVDELLASLRSKTNHHIPSVQRDFENDSNDAELQLALKLSLEEFERNSRKSIDNLEKCNQNNEECEKVLKISLQESQKANNILPRDEIALSGADSLETHTSGQITNSIESPVDEFDMMVSDCALKYSKLMQCSEKLQHSRVQQLKNMNKAMKRSQDTTSKHVLCEDTFAEALQQSNLEEKIQQKHLGSDSLENKCESPKSMPQPDTPQTPKDGLIYKTENITPMPKFEELSTPELHAELDKIGVKKLKRRLGIAILKNVYNSLHLPMIRQEIGDTLEMVEDDKEYRRPAKRRKKLDYEPNQCSSKSLPTDQVYIPLSSDEPLEELIFERKRSTKIASCPLPFHIAWHNFLCVHRSIWESVVSYEPIQVKDVHQMFKELGFKYHIQDMIKFFDRKCITIRIPQTN